VTLASAHFMLLAESESASQRSEFRLAERNSAAQVMDGMASRHAADEMTITAAGRRTPRRNG
jgi:hypothetical protein